MKEAVDIKRLISKYAIFIVFIILVALFSISKPEQFMTLDNAFTILRQVSMLGITAVGMTCVLIVGGIDLSVGTLQGFINVLIASMIIKYGIPIWVAIIIALAAGTIIGAFNGFLITRLKINPFITTLSTMTILKGIAFAWTGAFPVYGYPKEFAMIGQGYLLGIIPIPVIIMIIVFLAGYVLLSITYLGRHFYAVGGNAESSRLSGISVKNTKLYAYMICSFLASLSAIILSSRLGSGQPGAGGSFEFDVITAVILGGVSLSGGQGKLQVVVIGVLIMGLLANGMIIMGISEYYQWIIKGVVLIFAITLDRLNYITESSEST